MDVLVLDDDEGVGSVNLFAVYFGACANSLAESTKFFGAGLIPYGMEFGMIAELAIFKGLAGFLVEYRKGPFGEKSIRVVESSGRLGSD